MCVVDYEGDVCVWRGVVVRVFVVDDDGADVAVCDRLTCVVFACDCIDMIMCVRLHIGVMMALVPVSDGDAVVDVDGGADLNGLTELK